MEIALKSMAVVISATCVADLVMRLAKRRNEAIKTFLDLFFGYVALLLSLPLLAFCFVIIRCASRGPVIIRQVRIGKDGTPFEMYKLRTMYDNAELNTGAVWASDNDPRVVPVCRWMRKSHLDELPQLINVIRGDMSLVGPRPERGEILDELERTYPLVKRRLDVLPGITGLAQICCGYDTTPERYIHKLRADLEYIRSRHWSLDLRIILATVPKFLDSQSK